MFAMLIFGEIVNHHITHIITLVLKVSTYIMTRIAASPIRLADGTFWDTSDNVYLGLQN